MNSSMLGLVIIILTLILYAICLLFKNKIHLTPLFLSTKRAGKLRTRLTESYETGSPVHLDTFNADETQIISPAVLSGLSATEILSNRFSAADEPLLVTENSGAIHAFSRDAMLNGLRKAGLDNESQPASVEFAGFGNLSHQSAMLAQLADVNAAFHLIIGSSGSEIALQDLMFDDDASFIIAGDNLNGQATGLAVADDVFIGEQTYELPSLLSTDDRQKDIGLLVTDLLRYGLIFAILGGTLLVYLT